MAYENLKLKIAALSGEIYLARVNKNGMMSESGESQQMIA